jgi:hypothetical protein
MQLSARIIAAFLAATLIIAPALADEQLAADIAIIKRAGTPVPFPGVLYSEDAYAKMKAKQEFAKERAESQLKLELGLLESRLRLTTATTANDLIATKKSFQERLDIKDKRIKQLEDELIKVNERSTIGEWQKIIWFSIGVGSIMMGAIAINWVADKN